MEEQTIKLKLQPLTPEAFKPYGQVLENRQPVLPEVEPGEGRVAIEPLWRHESGRTASPWQHLGKVCTGRCCGAIG